MGSDQDEALSTAASGAVKNLLTRPYWTRVWIQQEVALPRAVHVQCGQLCVPFDGFVQANTSWEMLRRHMVGTSTAVFKRLVKTCQAKRAASHPTKILVRGCDFNFTTHDTPKY